MSDYVSKGKWRYQDCINYSFQGNLYFPVTGGAVFDVDVCTGKPGYMASSYPIAMLWEDRIMYGPSLQSLQLMDPVVLADFESPFADPSLPKNIQIDYDPFDTDFSIWYLVTDLYQMKGLWKSLFGSEVINRRFRRLDELDLKQTAKQLADDHLMVQFGILPTIRDMQDFWTIINNWTKKYDEADEHLSKTRPWHATPLRLTQYWPAHTERFGHAIVRDIAFDSSHFKWKAVDTVEAHMYRSASYSFTAPEFQGWLSRLKQFVDSFGIADPAALWDIVPFSFIVDWFYGVGNWLHQNRPRFFPADVLVHDYCESIKVVRSTQWFGTYLQNDGILNPLLPMVDTYLCGTTETAYVRRRFQPDLSHVSVPRKSKNVLSVRRALISAALVAQRLPR